MAFPAASSPAWQNLPNGNFSPVIYSQKVQKAFRKSSVVEDVTNTDYMGEIANYGDSVRIIKEPEITVSTYERGTVLAKTNLADADFTMVIDQANYYMFKIDDIEAAHSHVNFMDLATDRAAYRLRDTFDSEVLGYLAGYVYDAANSRWIVRTATNGTKADAAAGVDELLAANKLSITNFGGTAVAGTTGTFVPAVTGAQTSALTSIPVAAGGGTSGVTSPLEILNRMGRLMDTANVDSADRWFVADPVFYEVLMDENSKFVDRDFGGGSEIRNGRVGEGLIRGFRVYKSNNLAFVGTGPGTTASTGSRLNFGVLVAGHQSAVATAQQLSKTESYRDPDSFADIVRGMQLYGRKILRPEAIVTANYNLA
jgi:hypothetical protein